MTAPTEILEKLKKLLRLARSSNPHEAALAMEKAMALAAEHRVSLDQINPDHEAPRFTHRATAEHFVRLPAEHQFAASILGRFFRVRSIITSVCRQGRDGWPQRRQVVTLIGTETDVEIGLYVLGFLVHHFRFCWRHHRGRCRNRDAFMRGMFAGLYQKLLDAEPPAPPPTAASTALAVSMDGYLAQHFGKLEDKRLPGGSSDASAALRAGFAQGQRTEIRGGIKPGAPAPLALT